MNRAVRWFQLGGRQREFVLSVALGCSGVAVVGTCTYYRKPLLADGGKFTESWHSRPPVISHAHPDDQHSLRGPPVGSVADDKSQSQGRTAGASVPPPRTQGHSVFDTEGDVPTDHPLQAWQQATDRVAAVCGSFTGFDLTSLREKITGLLLPTWIRDLSGWLHKLQSELSMEPWSLSWEIWEEAHDPEINPEIVWDAHVRISSDLCSEERAFLQKRRPQTARALARYLGVPESDVHPRDVPTIGICGSGGGLRALVAGTSSYLSAAEDGLFDCVTYTAGVSGSCWLQTLYNSSIGRQSHGRIIQHLKDRIGVHIAYPPALLGLLSQAPTNKYLLSGYVEKLRGVPDADFGLVDVYGLALAARLLVPRGDLRVNDYDLKVSNQRFYTDEGQHPLPIYTAVRHEIPESAGDAQDAGKVARFTKKHYDWFQWFEWTPYEFFCDELNAGIPTWSVGRAWNRGECVWRENGFALPELRVPLMMGIWGSAFCATLSHYYKEIRPIIRSSGLGGLDTLLSGKSDDLVKVHPIDPAVIPNFAIGLKDRLPPSCPESMHHSTHLQLMDAGMANNLPIYPLLRPGRDVDVIIAFDASADVREDNWIKVVDGYARQRDIRGWPMGAGWPPRTNSGEQTVNQLNTAQTATNDQAGNTSSSNKYLDQTAKDLGYCTVWAGTTEERHEYMDEPAPKRIQTPEDDSHLLSPHAGIAVIYFPFLANEKIPGVDPMKDEFMSTWNFVYTPEQIDRVVQLARANFNEGKDQTRRTIRAVWERKRQARLQLEQEQLEHAKRWKIKRGAAAMRRDADHFGGV